MKMPYYQRKKKAFYKRKEFFTILIGAFFILLMALSAVNMGSNDEDVLDTVEYNGLEFSTALNYNGWLATTETGQQIILTYSPEFLSEIELDKVNLKSFNEKEKVYLSINPYETVQVALQDFQANIQFQARYVISCYEDNDVCKDLPLKTCDDATETIGIIVFKEAEKDSVSFEEDCLTIQGKDLLKVTDKLVLDYYG
jgi:hypothetical protein